MNYDPNDPNLLWEWRLVGSRWERVPTGYNDDWFVNDHETEDSSDPPVDPPDDPPLTLEEELELLRLRVEELETMLQKSFLLID